MSVMGFEKNAYKEVPESYFERMEQGGSIVKISYEAEDYVASEGKYGKNAYVYLPYGYDENDKTRKYNVLYLLHGGADNEKWYFNSENDYEQLRNILDHMVKDNIIEPCIICTPTYMNPHSKVIAESCRNFHKELLNELIPLVEGRFNCYAEDMSAQELVNTRMHRALGGFSMGAVTTWWTFMSMLDKIGYYMPMCGDSWCVEEKGGGSASEKTAQLLAESVSKSADKDKPFYIYSGTGTKDIAYPNLYPQIEAMKKQTDVFTYCESFDDGNLYCCVRDEGWHDINTVVRIVYNGLPKLFRK